MTSIYAGKKHKFTVSNNPEFRSLGLCSICGQMKGDKEAHIQEDEQIEEQIRRRSWTRIERKEKGVIIDKGSHA